MNPHTPKRLPRPRTLNLCLLVALLATPAACAMAGNDRAPARVDNLKQWFTRGQTDGSLRLFRYDNRNAFFLSGSNRKTTALGGRLHFTTAQLDGWSMRLGVVGQKNLFRGRRGHDRDLGVNVHALGDAWLQWQGHGFRVRAGNQELSGIPFHASYDYVVVPQIYQGVQASYEGTHGEVRVVRMFRYKSRIDTGYHRHTNYNPPFMPFPPNAGEHTTPGFLAVGGSTHGATSAVTWKSKTWYVEDIDYARMAFVQATVEKAAGSWRPFLSVQWIGQNGAGAAWLGPVHSRVRGVRLGLHRKSFTVTVNYDGIQRHEGAFLDGAPVTPYATNEASGPFFAQPLLTSTQDLGAGHAWSVDAGFAPSDHTYVGARYSVMDLHPNAQGSSIGQRGYMVFGSYHFRGSLQGLSVQDFFALQTQKVQARHYWENRLSLVYDF